MLRGASSTLCTSGFVDDVMVSHNLPYCTYGMCIQKRQEEIIPAEITASISANSCLKIHASSIRYASYGLCIGVRSITYKSIPSSLFYLAAIPHLGFVVRILDHPRRVFGGLVFIVMQNLVEIDAAFSIFKMHVIV